MIWFFIWIEVVNINGSINVERVFIVIIYIVININLNMFNVEIDLNFC